MNEPHKIVQVSVDIAEKYKDYSPERSYVEKKKRNKKEKSLSWKGTSTWGTPQLNSLGWIETTTQEIHISTLIQLNWSINTDKHSKLCRAMEGAFCHDKSTNKLG